MNTKVVMGGAALLLLGIGCLVLRNQMIAAHEELGERWANVDATLQRRLDLIPRLVEVVQEAAGHERETLLELTEARNEILALVERMKGSMAEGDRAAVPAVEADLAASVRAYTGLAREAYPQLGSLEAFRDLMSQLEGSENRINVARQDYNHAVARHNTLIRQWGWLPLSGAGEPAEPFQASAGAGEALELPF